jgi:hypothetical protein
MNTTLEMELGMDMDTNKNPDMRRKIACNLPCEI